MQLKNCVCKKPWSIYEIDIAPYTINQPLKLC